MLFIGRAGSTPVLGTKILDDVLVVKDFVFSCLTFVQQIVDGNERCSEGTAFKERD